MKLNVQIQAACFLLLFLATLTNTSILPKQARQLAGSQPPDTAVAEAEAEANTPVLRRLRRDSHFPVCLYCCNCCKRTTCGLCCVT